MVKVKRDLTGMIFGRLRVIRQTEDYIDPCGNHRAKWLCECSCEEHTMVEVKGASLTTKSNPTKSCGCIQREAVALTSKTYRKKTNIYSNIHTDEYGDYYIGYCSNTNREFYVDADDYDKIKDYCWYEHCPAVRFSTLTTFDGESRKHIKMHQLLGFAYHDHIDRNELNNRKHNLRACGQQENAFNKSMRSDNTSGIIGVSWNKQAEKWCAELRANGHRYCKHFNNFDDAVRARLLAEQKYFGEFAPQQDLYEKYGISNTIE